MAGTSLQRVKDADSALGLAASYVVAHAPFGSYRADRLIGALSGQVRRHHYVFAVRDGVVVGYAGWALCPHDVAEDWLTNNKAPRPEQCLAGDVIVLMVMVAADREALRRITAHLRQAYGGKTYMAQRPTRAGGFLRKGRVGQARRASGEDLMPRP